jgi:hypothetical protein
MFMIHGTPPRMKIGTFNVVGRIFTLGWQVAQIQSLKVIAIDEPEVAIRPTHWPSPCIRNHRSLRQCAPLRITVALL